MKDKIVEVTSQESKFITSDTAEGPVITLKTAKDLQRDMLIDEKS